MYQNSKTNTITSTPNWFQILDSTKRETANELNCVRIGIVQAVYYDSLTVDVLITNKRTLSINNDGTQEVENYPLIRANIVFCNPYITNPIFAGDECVLLFNDREQESWFINGGINAEAHPRMHALTDAVAIFGIRSLPKMISILQDALHLFYKYQGSDIQIKEEEIITNTKKFTQNITNTIEISTTTSNLTTTTNNINATTNNLTATTNNITATTNHNGTFNSSLINDTTAASGSFISKDDKLVVVSNGIVRSITGAG